MKKQTFLLICLLYALSAVAQNRKVNMALQLPLKEVLDKATRENKYVFLDFGSPRCSPCLWIKKNLFTIDSIADFINDRFVSVDYQEGEEKKRLSQMYGVVGEPVLIILDSKGNLMHKMVGKCTAAEMMARFKQGLDKNENFVAHNAKYKNGDRNPEFLLKYLETLFVAKEVTQMNLVLQEVFDVPLDSLKSKSYWKLFVRYNEDPVSKQMLYVFDHREEFYKLFGKDIVESKINVIYGAKASYYLFGHTAPVKDSAFNTMLSYLQHTDYEKATEWLASFVPARYKFTDWPAMAREINNVLSFNILKGKKKDMYMKMMAEQLYWYSDDKKALPSALQWIDALLPDADETTKKSLLETRKGIEGKLRTDASAHASRQ